MIQGVNKKSIYAFVKHIHDLQLFKQLLKKKLPKQKK